MVKLLLRMFIASVFCVGFCHGQTESSCDFSSYSPFAFDHFLPSGLVKKVVPIYPAAARAVGAHGIVRVKILVNRIGVVKDACVIEGHPLLRASAIDAARASQFKRNFGLSLPQRRRYIQDVLVFDFKR